MGMHDKKQQDLGRTPRTRFAFAAGVLIAVVIGVIAYLALGTRQYQASEDISRSTESQAPSSAVSPGGSGSNPVAGWLSTATPPYDETQSAMESLSNSIAEQNISAVKDDCQRVYDASRRLEATLPSPDAGLTSEVVAAIDAINSGFSQCEALTPSNADEDDGETLRSVFRQARTHLDQARNIAQGLLSG